MSANPRLPSLPRLRLPRLGIRARLLLLMAAMGLPFLIYLITSVALTFDAERDHARRELRDAAQLAAARVDDQLSSLTLLVNTLGHSLGPVLDNPQRVDALLRGLGPEVLQEVYNVTVWRPDGSNVASLLPAVRKNMPSIASKGYFQEILRTRRMVVAAPVASSASGEYIMGFGTPIMRDGQLVGVIGVSLQLSRLQQVLDPQRSLPEGGVITVFDAEGTVVWRSLDAARWIGQRLKVPRIVAKLQQSTPGASEEPSFDGVPRLFGHAAIKTVPWSVVIGVPTEQAAAPSKARLQQSLVFGTVMLVIGLLLALWASEHIARPLHQLGKDAEQVGQGDLAHRNRVRGPPEINRLARTLNEMAGALQQRATALTASKALLRKVTDHVPALVSLLDRDERFRFANLAYCDWLGTEPAALLGRSLSDVYGLELYAALQPHLHAAWSGQRTVYEHPMTTLAGERWVQVNLVPCHTHEATQQGPVTELCVMILDVTERRAAQERLVRSEERLNLALEGSSLALFDWDVPGQRIYHSAQGAVLRGAAPMEEVLPPETWRTMVHPDDVEAASAAVVLTLKGQTESFAAELRVRTVSGGWVWVRRTGRVVERDAQGRAVRVAGTDVDLTQRKATETRLRQLAETDSLTGLPNRTLFTDRLQQATRRAARTGQPLAVLFLDIDHFKQVNDRFGHEAGDQLLKAFAQRLQAGIRSSDTVARLAGDEFTVILEQTHASDGVRLIAQALVAAARAPVALSHPAGDGAIELHITTSVGAAVWTAGPLDGMALLRRADAALYEAKRQGRDRCWVVDAQVVVDAVETTAVTPVAAPGTACPA
ncbi:MAG: diguanylate cyclase [Burkholderiales bacterium]